MAAATTRKRFGPQPKGVRRQFTLRVPDEHFHLYQERADAEGLSLGDYLAVQLARSHDLPEPGYVRRKSAADGSFMLPLTATG